jgi:hypothetical protein
MMTTLSAEKITNGMTAGSVKPTRNGYSAEVSPKRLVYVNRPLPKDPPQLVIGNGDHTCQIIPLTEEQHKALARDLLSMLLTTSVFA